MSRILQSSVIPLLSQKDYSWVWTKNPKLYQSDFLKEKMIEISVPLYREDRPTGEVISIFVKFNDSLYPQFDHVHHSCHFICRDKKFSNRYIVNGFKSSTAKSAVWFNIDDIQKNSYVVAAKQEAIMRWTLMIDLYNEGLEDLCWQKALPIAKKAFDEVRVMMEVGWIDGVWFSDAIEWFEKNGFTDIPPVEKWKNCDGLGGWEIESHPSYGCTAGTNVRIDWENKKFVIYTWDSGD